ncbi:MAG: 2-oxo acid dehydrogenase subunit E2 [Halobacteriota archaeon]
MGYVIRMPQLGMSMDEGTVVEWSVDEGDEVVAGDVLVVVESEKASHEVEAREDGVLRRIAVPEGGVVEPGTPIGVVAGASEDLSEYLAQLPEAAESSDEAATESAPGRATRATDSDAGSAERDAGESVRATPGARRRANEAGVDLAGIDGTGPQGVITESDVEEFLESRATEVEAGSDEAIGEPTPEGYEKSQTISETRELTGIQRTIAKRLGESYSNAVHVTLNRSFDVSALRAVTAAAESVDGADASLTDLLLKGVADALTAFPDFNALFEEGEHKLVEEVNLGVAVDVERGLLTPVIPSVAERSAESVHAIRTALTARVDSGDFSMDDLSGGTFTVSNLGPYGVDDFDPVINPPQIAILGVGRIRDDESMTLSLSFDHRVVNGADAARFLDRIVECLTDEARLAGYFEASVPTEPTLDEREVRVETSGGFVGRYRTAFGDVAFDEPEEVGGTGSAPSPVDHLLGALGSCLALAVTDRARRDDVAIDSVATTVRGTPPRGSLEAVELELELETDADVSDLDQVVTKAERACYVSRSLSEDLPVAVDWTRV